MPKLLLLTTVIVTFTLLVPTIQSACCCDTRSCHEGSYCHNYSDQPIQFVCTACPIGKFCPGDAKIYNCSDTTFAPVQKLAQCLPCNGKPSPSKVFCFPLNLPSSAIEVPIKVDISASNSKLNVTNQRNYFTTLTLFRDAPSPRFTLFTISTNSSSLKLFGSSTSGNPNEQDYDQTSKGMTVRVLIKEDPTYPLIQPWYFSLLSEATGATALLNAFPTNGTSIDLLSSKETFIFSKPNYRFFKIQSVPKGKQVKISIQSEKRQQSWKYTCVQGMYLSESDPSEEYPCETGKNELVSQVTTDQTVLLTNYTTAPRVEDGPLYFSMKMSCFVSFEAMKTTISIE